VGRTLGALTFPAFLLLGKDRGDDMGIRISMFVGAIVVFISILVFKKMFEEESLTEWWPSYELAEDAGNI
jgi:hypothetical protein